MIRTLLAGILLLAACNPSGTRPLVTPLPEADTASLALPVPTATRRVADALVAAGLPVTRVEERDGWLATPWFEAASLEATRRRPVGPEVVRLRAWVNLSMRGHSTVTFETVFRPMADPSLPGRELERALPPGHPVAQRVRRVLDSLAGRTTP